MLNTSQLNRTPARRLIAAIAPVALLACTGGVASAQVEVERSVETEMSVLGVSPTKSQQITIERNGQVSELKIENGEIVSVRHGGKEWPRDRVRESDGSVELVGEDGVVVVRFSMPQKPAAPASPFPDDASTPGDDDRRVVRRFVSVPPSALTAPTAPAAPIAPTPPPVMLGINMSQPGDALRAQLGLGDRPAILVEGVIDGLPAAKAGLKKHDIIVSIGGSDGASDRTLSETLAKAKPGQVITLKVRRSGDTIEISPEVEAYDAERLRSGPSVMVFRGEGEGEGEGWSGRFEFNVEGEDIAAHAERLAELAARGGQQTAEEMQRLAEEIQQAASRQVFELRDNRLFVRSREQLQEMMQEQIDGLIRENRQLAQERAEQAQGRVEQIRPQIQESLDNRLRQIEQRMDSIEKSLDSRLERLSDMLDRLADRLEQEAGE